MYLLIGGLVTLFGFGVLYVLVDRLHVDKNLAFFIQTVINLEILFVLYNWHVWGHRISTSTKKSVGKRWAKFHIARAVAMISGQVMFFALSLKIYYLLANAAVVVFVTLINYSLSDKFVFLDENEEPLKR